LPDSSIDCSNFRLEWRPSRWEAGLRLLLPPLAAHAVGMSALAGALPDPLRALMPVLGALLGLLDAGRALARRPATLELEGSMPPRLHEQWPVLVVRVGAKSPTRVFWPDTLSPAARRALRLAARCPPGQPGLPPHWMG
jgi:hypothetical protein